MVLTKLDNSLRIDIPTGFIDVGILITNNSLKGII
jgi:hypothetical protein